MVQYSYDAFGRLIERTVTNTPTRYYYAGWQLIEERDGSGTLQRKYVYGPSIDEPVRMSSSGTNYYFHAVALDSITEITDATGGLVEQYRYDAYGAPTIYDSNGSPLSASAISNRLLFTGRDRDPDTGLYNFRYRYYSPTLGRFAQPDPIRLHGGSLNLYGYVWNNPLVYLDPFGLSSWHWSGWDLIPPVAFVHAFYDVGAGFSEGLIGLSHAMDSASSTASSLASTYDSASSPGGSVPSTMGGPVTGALPGIGSGIAAGISGIPGTPFTGDVPDDLIGTAVGGAITGAGCP